MLGSVRSALIISDGMHYDAGSISTCFLADRNVPHPLNSCTAFLLTGIVPMAHFAFISRNLRLLSYGFFKVLHTIPSSHIFAMHCLCKVAENVPQRQRRTITQHSRFGKCLKVVMCNDAGNRGLIHRSICCCYVRCFPAVHQALPWGHGPIHPHSPLVAEVPFTSLIF